MALERKPQTAAPAFERRRPAPAAAQRRPAPPPSPARSLQARLGNQGTQSLVVRSTRVEAGPTAAKARPPVPAEKEQEQEKKPAKKGEEREKAAPPSPKKAIAPAVSAVKERSTRARKRGDEKALVGSAQEAAKDPKVEATREAADATVQALAAAETAKVRREKFKADLSKAIREATPEPKTKEQAEKVIQTGGRNASNALASSLATERDAAAGGMKGAAATEVAPSPAGTKVNVECEAVGPKPAPVSAAPVVPAPLPPERLDYSSDRESTDKAMEESGVTTEQLGKGNEPQFNKTLSERSAAEKHEAAAEAKYRQSEAAVRGQTKAGAQDVLAQELAGIHGSRELRIGEVTGQQNATKTKDAQERERVTTTINGIKDKTRQDVAGILTRMETDAAAIFEGGLGRAEKAFEDTFEEEKGGIGTWLTTWGDDWEDLIERSLRKARDEYFRQVDLAIDKVADLIDARLEEAKARVAAGRKQVEDFVGTLKGKVKEFGDEALREVTADFDAMASEIDQRRDALIDKLVQQYKASYERMSAKEEALREANKSFWQRVYDATVGVIKKILAFKDMLVSILAKAASVIADIISDPIGFLGNLVSAVMTGLENFMGNIGKHLEKGLMEWLFGALGGAGLQMPDKFDLRGILSIILQVLGLTPANFRARAVAILGAPVVEAIEKTAEIFTIVRTQGVAGLWDLIKEKISDLKSMVMDAVFDYVKERVLIAGVTWIIGLLNPVSAFFKACKAIYDLVKFFIERASQIAALISAIIDSIAAIAKGQLANAIKGVENALAKAIPVAIGFLAALLSLGDISGKIRALIDRARQPVNKAIDWVIGVAAKGAKVVVAKGKAAVKKVLAWAFATKKFKDARGESHTLYVNEEAELTVASTPRAAKEFVDWYVKTHNGDATIAAEARTLIAAAQKLVTQIRKSTDMSPEGVPAPAKQAELLAINTQISEKLSQLVGRDPKVAANLEKKYLLEGQVGTYATVPKPVGDQLTPDHQPQASIIQGAAKFFRTRGIKGEELAKRAENRAAQGYAINLHFKRHVAGATYGGKGEKQDDFYKRLVNMAKGKTLEQAKEGAVGFLREALNRDVAQMKSVAGKEIDEEPWAQLKEEFKDDPATAKKLKGQIAKRIISGEDQIASQPLDF